MSTQAEDASTARTAQAQVTTANAARDGTGTVATIFTAGSSGSRIDDLTIQATATTTAGMVRLFLHDGTNTRLFREISVSAATPSATVAAYTSSLSNLALILQSGWSLRASTEKAETFNVLVTRAGDF
jgi:hypothetical protein